MESGKVTLSRQVYMPMTECVTLDGQIKLIPKEKLTLRPATFGIIVHKNKLLKLRVRHTGKIHLPGGGIETGESLTTGLKREIREETGIEVEVNRLAHFHELFFYYDPSESAYHGLHFYYICQPLSVELLKDDEVNDGTAEKPRWTELAQLRSDDFQNQGEAILRKCSQSSGNMAI